MKKILFSCAFLAVLIFAGCSSSDGGDKQIKLSNQSEKTQQAYADEETTGGFTFTSLSSWTASVTANTRASTVSWLRLLLDGAETYAGEAGTVRLVIELDVNYTGATRSATITITSGGDKITVTVIQDGKTEDDEIPAHYPMRYVRRIVERNSSEVITTEFDYDNGKVTEIKTSYPGSEHVITFTYSDRKVSYTSTERDGTAATICTGVLTLNSNGYVTSGEFLCDRQDAGQWTTTYANEQLTGVSGTYNDGSEQTSYTKSLAWTGSNMTFYENNTSASTENATIAFSSIPNNPLVNLDLNWLVGVEALAFVIEGCGDFQTIYPFAMGLYGKRSAYMISDVSYENYGTGTTGYSYQLDSNGLITRVDTDNASYEVSYR